MKKTIVSTNRLMILAMMMVMTISANAARPPVACYHRDARMQVTSEDADNKIRFASIYAFKKGHENSQEWEFLRPFSSKRQVDYPFYM